MQTRKQTWRQWARAVLRDPSSPSKITKDMIAALTGTDARVLDAIVACLEAYAYTGDPLVFDALRVLVRLMQVHTRPLARELIPFVLCWEDRERLWPRMAPVSDGGHDYSEGVIPKGDLKIVFENRDGRQCEDGDVGLGNPLGRAHP